MLAVFLPHAPARAELAKLQGDLDAGGDGRDIELFASDFPWLKWVDTNFPRGSTTPANYIARRCAQGTRHADRQRRALPVAAAAGVMAPLLGVIITVLGLRGAQPPDSLAVPEGGKQSLGDILYTVTPLVAGVGTGPSWPSSTSGCCIWREARSKWCGTPPGPGSTPRSGATSGLDTQAATVKAITAMEKMARTVLQSAEHQEQELGDAAGQHRRDQCWPP